MRYLEVGWFRAPRVDTPFHYFIGDGVFPAEAACGKMRWPASSAAVMRVCRLKAARCKRCEAVLAARRRVGVKSLDVRMDRKPTRPTRKGRAK